MKPKILIVDDDSNLIRLYESALSARGYRVVTAVDGEKALIAAEREQPDLIMLDVMMPSLHGLNVLDILKATPGMENVKFMILTALSDEATKEKALSLGADYFVVKSESSMADILQLINEACS